MNAERMQAIRQALAGMNFRVAPTYEDVILMIETALNHGTAGAVPVSRTGQPLQSPQVPVSPPLGTRGPVTYPVVPPGGVQTDAQRAGLSDAEWNALTTEQRRDRLAQAPPAATVSDAQRAGMTDAAWAALTDEQRRVRGVGVVPQGPVGLPAFNRQASTEAAQEAVDRERARSGAEANARGMNPPIQPISGAPSTDASRAGLTEAEWSALTDEQRRARVTGAVSVPGSVEIAARAGLTEAQWAALPEEQRRARRAGVTNTVGDVPYPVPGTPSTEAQRAGLTEAEWLALTDEQRRVRTNSTVQGGPMTPPLPHLTPQPSAVPSVPPVPNPTAAQLQADAKAKADAAALTRANTKA